MLRSLTVKNFMIIEELQLEFDAGMSAITGETGAGKSILAGALGLALGKRAQSHYSGRAGKLSVTLDIDLNLLPQTRNWLEENELESDRECILRRTLTPDGRSRAFINGLQVSLAQLQVLGSQLVETVGQNMQQPLVQPGEQIAIVDSQCGHADNLREMANTQRQWTVLSEKLKSRLEQSDALKARTTLLQYQTRELQEFAAEEEEFRAIEQSHKRLAKKELLQQELHKALELLEESESHDAASRISDAVRAIEPLADTSDSITTAVGQLHTAQDHLQIAGREIRSCLEQSDIDTEKYHEIEKRLQGYFDLARKYGTSPEKLAGLYQNLKSELETIEAPDARPEEMQRQLEELENRYSTLADKVSTKRKGAAARLSREVTRTLQKLNMKNAEFTISLKPAADDTLSRFGKERAEFFIRTSPGHPAAPLAQAASGGELSRINLALQAAIAAKSRIPTLIFDEVDTGVGGKTAEMVGRLLKLISRDTQVLCITHLPQIAAQADHHFTVNRQTGRNHTCITVSRLSPSERQREIARMMAGARITRRSLAHAGEMLGQGDKTAATE